ncbi:MAG: hypothetical protein IJ877_07460 [Candidatus Gastranaerophilales bacterium]|nr:hypothetical protein [Candidatus Gastranaerophilales bacterium]
MENSLKTAKDLIQNIYKNYSFKDICNSLFILTNALENISSNVKGVFLYLCLLEMYDYNFCKEDKINSYCNFFDFFEKIKKYVPDFFMLEDYIPQDDWGDVYYYINEKCYKYLYGGELDNTYDFLKFFELYHCSMKGIFQKIINRNPKDDFIKFLQLQNEVINSIKKPKISKMKLADFKAPDEFFWKEFNTFLNSKLNLYDIFDSQTLDFYSVKGKIQDKIFNGRNFENAFFEGRILNSVFIKKDGKYYLMQLRRMFCVIIEIWNNIIADNISILETKENNLILKNSLFNYCDEKIPFNAHFYNNVSIINDEKEYLKTDALLICNNKLIFMILRDFKAEILADKKLKDLKNINNKIRKIKKDFTKQSAIMLSKDNVPIAIPNQNGIELEFLVISPRIDLSLDLVAFEYSPEFLFFTYTDFIRFVDEFLNAADITEKIDFLKNKEKPFLSSNSDMLGLFSTNEGEISTGYYENVKLVLGSSFGNDTRYENLKTFWKLSPKSTIFNIAPYNWQLEKWDNSPYTNMFSPKYMAFALFFKIFDTEVFVHSPAKPDIALAKPIEVFSEMIGDIFLRYDKILKNHYYFKTNKLLQISIVPKGYLEDCERKILKDNIWKIDKVNFKKNCFALQIIFDEGKYYDVLENTNDRTIQIQLFYDIINTINADFPDNTATDELFKKTELEKNKITRFKVTRYLKENCFPVVCDVVCPKEKDFIKVQNVIAKILHKNNIECGKYDLSEAKKIIDILKENLINKINEEVKQYDFYEAIKNLIKNNDANIHYYNNKERKIKISTSHEVDYKREEALKEAHEKFIRNSKNYRFLIEKFTQFHPRGTKKLDNKALGFLLALTDWLIITHGQSDIIHYNILATGIIVHENKTIETVFEKDYIEKEDMYSKIEAEERLYKKEDEDIIFTSVMDFYDDFCEAFKQDFGFNYQSIFNLLRVLSGWCSEDRTYIIANKDEIKEKTKTLIKNFSKEEENELSKIIDFLTLEQEDITKVIDKNNNKKKFQCKDIPLDEFNLRFCRYTLKPLIKYNNSYIWGPYSAEMTSRVFTGHLFNTKMPHGGLEGKASEILARIKNIHEKELVQNTYKIVKKYTKFADKEVEFHKRDKEGKHLEELGDYDVLAYLENINTLLNIECKHHIPAYSVKDARKYLDKIYEPDKNNKSAVDRVSNREAYIKKNYQAALKILNVKNIKKPKVISLYVTKIGNFYIKFPNKNTNIKFLAVDELNEYISSLLSV